MRRISASANPTAGALSTARLERIVIDASHVNAKKPIGILDIQETVTALTQLLARKDLRDRYSDEVLKIIVY